MSAHLKPELKHSGELVRDALRELVLAKKTGGRAGIAHAFRRLQRARIEAAHVRRYRRAVRDDVFADETQIAGV